LIFFGPSGGRGFDQYYYALEDKLVQDFSFLPFGWADIEVEEGVYDWSEIDALIAECKANNRRFLQLFGLQHILMSIH
jgi:hypothetical protein